MLCIDLFSCILYYKRNEEETEREHLLSTPKRYELK